MTSTVGGHRKSAMFSPRSVATANDVIVVVAVTLTLMTSCVADAAGKLDAGRQRRAHHGGRAVVTWYNDVTDYRYNSVLQRDDPTKLDEVYYKKLCYHKEDSASVVLS